MYPVTLIRVSKNRRVFVEMKNDEIFEGTMIDCDMLMNILLSDVYILSKENKFYISECFLRGAFIKSVKLSTSVFGVQKRFEKIKKSKHEKEENTS